MQNHTGRRDYDAMVHFRAIQPGEPTFLIRGQDALSERGAIAYAALLHNEGGPPELVESVLQQADALAAWRPKKLPDASHLTQAESKQLIYQLSRRAVRDELDKPPGARLLLAERRGLDLGLARGRRALDALEQLVELRRLKEGGAAEAVYQARRPFAWAHAELVVMEARRAIVAPSIIDLAADMAAGGFR